MDISPAGEHLSVF